MTCGLSARSLAALVALFVLAGVPLCAQQGKWASADDPVAKNLIDWERQWAEADCVHNMVEEQILADDFQGTSPENGAIYSKAEAVADAKKPTTQTRDCHLRDAKVRFFGLDLAIVYGSESSIRKGKDGKDFKRSLVWTDTWLKRNGQWQIVAAQDMRMERK
jgi:Domain of unknown function (DUF4440)